MKKASENSNRREQSRAVANTSAQRKKGGKGTLGFVDNRSEVIEEKEQMKGIAGGAVQNKENGGTNSGPADNRPQANEKVIRQFMHRGAAIIQMMAKDDWLAKAKKLHQACCQQQAGKNGGGRLNGSEAEMLNQLQHAIGSHHGVKRVTYNEARESLDTMFDMVKGGLKDDQLS